jgi:hypothetical protein
MKRLFVLLSILALIGCENLVTELPKTDVSLYQVSDGYKFPKNTPAIDIYNCLVSQGLDFGTEIPVTGTYTITQSATLNGKVYTDKKTKDVSSVRLQYIKLEAEINEHTVFFTQDDNSKLECRFKWQRQTTNVWKNDKLEGELSIIL